MEELATDPIGHLFEKLTKAESLRNWPNVIDIGERILKLLPYHQPTRSRTAAAHFKRWSSKSKESFFDYAIEVRAPDAKAGRKRYMHVWDLEEGVRNEILADLNRAIELDANNAEYYHWRSQFDYGRSVADLTRAIELDPENGKYYFRRSAVLEFEDKKEASRRDLQRAVELRDEAALRREEVLRGRHGRWISNA